MLFDTKFIVQILLSFFSVFLFFLFSLHPLFLSYEDKDKNGHLLERDSFIATPLLLSANFDRLEGGGGTPDTSSRSPKQIYESVSVLLAQWWSEGKEKEKTRSRASFYDGETIDALRKRACISTIYGRYVEILNSRNKVAIKL